MDLFPSFIYEDVEGINDFLSENGFVIANLPEPEAVDNIAEEMVEITGSFLNEKLDGLKDAHQFITSDEHHFALQKTLAEYFWRDNNCFDMVHKQRKLFWALFGMDIHVQSEPYVRIARPNISQDNIGLHRDTMYGASPYELSCFFPLVDLDKDSGLRVIPGSHIKSDTEYQWVRFESDHVEKGSERHKLGYPYAPNIIDPEREDDATAIPLKVGQVLLFSLSLVHGQVLNRADSTRFSADVRLVNSWAPIQWGRGVNENYYRPLTMSGVSSQARSYMNANNDQPVVD